LAPFRNWAYRLFSTDFEEVPFRSGRKPVVEVVLRRLILASLPALLIQERRSVNLQRDLPETIRHSICRSILRSPENVDLPVAGLA